MRAKTYSIWVEDTKHGSVKTSNVADYLEEEFGDISHRISVDEEKKKIYIHMSEMEVMVRARRLAGQFASPVSPEAIELSAQAAMHMKLLNQLEIIEEDYDGPDLYMADVENNALNRSILMQVGIPEDQLPPSDDIYAELDIIDMVWQYASAQYKHDRFVWIV